MRPTAVSRGSTAGSRHYEPAGLDEALDAEGRARAHYQSVLAAIEAAGAARLRADGNRLLIGVQWHAEFLVGRAPERALLQEFIAASLRRQREMCW
jgi:hypothetical protein